ncbi:c-type cytochrome biogenesis protein CcmI [Aestuariibacter salexigens]|uniref:c-type cytochrome biogenesis protein CcmI n=1 Tax=Aestuariibacter salexigens TaxID=226010 RepID=UPI0003F63172|nr:c-type cytochrome biogenesis protein CcmI [Aestuariibacter salexigens]
MLVFWLLAVAMLAALLLVVALPWLRQGGRQSQDVMSNTQIVRQRLDELEKEQQQGLISAEDKAQAIKELKLALVDEQNNARAASTSPSLVLTSGGLLALIVGAGVYWYSNQLEGLATLHNAQDRLTELSERIVMNPDPSIQPSDIQDFALALRKRLHDDERQGRQDATGWMLLGRLYLSVRQMEQTIQAFDKALTIQPNNTGVLGSLGQALVMTGDKASQRRAVTVLNTLLNIDPENDNAKLMLVVASVETGNLDVARQYFAQVKDKLPASDPMLVSLRNRLYPDENGNAASPQTGFEVVVDIDATLKEKLPPQATLFVFAQDAMSEARMPAAVVKTALGSLPTTVLLTDADAMMPTFRVSQLQRARLVARVSMDQNVDIATGELQGMAEAEVIIGEVSQQSITINEEIL